MAGGYNPQPKNDLEKLTRRVADLEKMVDRLRSAAGIRNSSISDGGDLVVLDLNGNQVVKLGHDSAGNRGLAATTPGGVDMIDFYIEPTLHTPVLRLRDENGGAIFISDSDGTGSGLAWPWLHFAFGNMTIAQWPFNTSGTFTTIAQAQTFWISQKMTVDCRTICDGGATAGQIRVLVNGSPLGSTVAVGTGAGDARFIDTVAGSIGDSVFVEIQTRVTAGAGNCRAQWYQAQWVEFEAI